MNGINRRIIPRLQQNEPWTIWKQIWTLQTNYSNMFGNFLKWLVENYIHVVIEYHPITLVGKIDYKLEDNNTVAISHSTHEKLKDLFQAHTDVIEHMRQTKDTFVKVLKQIGE